MKLRIAAVLILAASPLGAQQPVGIGTSLSSGETQSGAQTCCPPEPPIPGKQGSSNMKMMAHVPLGAWLTVSDVDIEQELSRPYAYVARGVVSGTAGVDIIDLRDLNNPNALKKAKRIWHWDIENAALHQGLGALNPMYFKMKGRYYLTLGVQFQQGGPDADLGAIVWDVTSLPNVAGIREVGRIRAPGQPGGFHETFAYRHSDGRTLLFTTAVEPFAHIYDMEKFVAGAPDFGLIGKVPVPQGSQDPTRTRGYHDFYVAYDVQTKQDKFYGAGAGGYYVFDVSRPEEAKLITSVTGVSGVTNGHTFTPDPLGRFAVIETEYQYAPLRMVDLKPKGDGTNHEGNINRAIGAWTANWKNLAHNHEVRWPYVFVSAYEDGLGIMNIMDPTNPITVGYYDTYEGPHMRGACGAPYGICNGAFGVDVRNADGLIVISDMSTGFWAFKMEGFDGWNGRDWGMPNISSAQDWDNGPEGAPKPARPVTMR